MMQLPKTDPSAFIAPDADVYGDVHIGADSSVWFHAVVRAETARIEVGQGSNIQDNAVVHVDEGHSVRIGDYVTIGHGAIIHGCVIGDNSLVGMGAIVLNGASIGKNCIIGAGALVTQNAVIPDGSLVYGSPACVKRQISDAEAEQNLRNAQHYIKEGKEYAEFFQNQKQCR